MEQTPMEVLRKIVALDADEPLPQATLRFEWADEWNSAMAAARALVAAQPATALPDAARPEMTDAQIFDLTNLHFGRKGNNLIWETDPSYAAAIGCEKDARWIATVRPGQTLAFARALLSRAPAAAVEDAHTPNADYCESYIEELLDFSKIVDPEVRKLLDFARAAAQPREVRMLTDDEVLQVTAHARYHDAREVQAKFVSVNGLQLKEPK